MDALHVSASKASIYLKASTFRLNAAQTAFTTAQQAFTAALTNVKSGTPDAKKQADQAASALKIAQANLDAARSEVEARKAEADNAKSAFNENYASRPRRLHAVNGYIRDEEAHVPRTTGDNGCPLTIKAFQEGSKIGFNYVDMTASDFPAPPSGPCSNRTCLLTKSERALDACADNIRQAFAGMNARDLKTAAQNYAPDRFGSEDAKLAAELKAKAGEVHAVLQSMLSQIRSDKKQRKQEKKAQNTVSKGFRKN